MRAAVLQAYNEPMVIEEITLADLGPTSVRIHIDASGVCHSDLTAAQGKVPMGTPLILGHEGAGTVLAVGSDVSRVKVGDRIIASFVPACGNCFFCLHDQSQLCEGMGAASFGVKGTRPDGSEVAGHDRARHVRRRDADRRVDVREDRDRPAVRAARAHRLRGHHRRGRRPQHRADQAGVHRRHHRLRRRRAVRPPGRAHRRRVADLRHRPGRDEAEDGGAARRHRPHRSRRRRSRRAGAGAHRGPRRRLRVRGHRPAGDDPAGLRHGAPRAAPRSSSACRRSTRPSPSRRWSSSTARRPCSGCMYGGAQVRRDFPRFVRLVETGRLDIGSMVSRRIKLDEVNDAFRAMEAGEVIRSVIV